jgi:hypothetical protein
MNFTLTINTDNESFQPNVGPELVRILRDVANQINTVACNPLAPRHLHEMHDVSLFDSNGNTIGTVNFH